MILLVDDETGTTIDLSMAVLPFEFEAIARANQVMSDALAVPVLSVEDLLVMKALAHRPQDVADIFAILRVQTNIDLRRVRRYLKQFADALDDPEVVESFERIYRQVKSPDGRR